MLPIFMMTFPSGTRSAAAMTNTQSERWGRTRMRRPHRFCAAKLRQSASTRTGMLLTKKTEAAERRSATASTIWACRFFRQRPELPSVAARCAQMVPLFLIDGFPILPQKNAVMIPLAVLKISIAPKSVNVPRPR